MTSKAFWLFCLALLFVWDCLAVENSLKMHTMFDDDMVLQRGIPIKIWGIARPGSEVVVRFAEQEKKANANEQGNWTIVLDSLTESSVPRVLVVSSEKESQRIENVLVGDVWLCSGQSNMEWIVVNSKNAKEEIQEAKYPEIRFFTVKRKAIGEPIKTLQGEWVVCSPETVKWFSAVGYFFGRKLHQDLKIPIGLINSSWGGTPAEAWTTFKTLENDPELSPIVKRYRKDLDNDSMEKYKKSVEEWEKNKGPRKENELLVDTGNQGFEKGWANPDLDDSDWKMMKLPCLWETIMNIDGAIWFRREIEIPENEVGKDISLSLGAIDDFDETYFNGEKIGGIGKETGNAWVTPREYKIPGKLVKSGKNCLAIRVFDHIGSGGFSGEPKEMYIEIDGKRVNISGEWKYKIEFSFFSSLKPEPPMGPQNPYAPSTLYNGMISPIIPYGIKGVIWYQGESNAWRAYQYRTLLPAMIQDWRREWAQPEPFKDFPFIIVQLANFTTPAEEPSNSDWAELREAQAMTAFGVKNCGLAVAIDIGEARDIHPRNKQDVGYRLALSALKIAYGKDIVFSGPIYDSMKIEGDKIILSFKNTGSGLVAKDGDLKHFSIAGENRTFVWAKAKIEGDKVIVWHDDVKKIVAVRYAWANNPEGCNLYNKEGLPAVPFRTDDWPGITAKIK